MLLLRSVAGSRLYGTFTENSDFDFFEVHDHIKPNQRKLADGTDTIKMPLSQWLRLCEKGTHQALDAMWCPPELTEVDRLGVAFRFSYRVDPWRVHDQLIQTAVARDKHALRLRHLADTVLERGWYDPTEWGRMRGEE